MQENIPTHISFSCGPSPNMVVLGRLTFDLDDWIAHTPKSTLAKNFGVNATVFDSVPGPHPTILNGTVSNTTELSGRGGLTEEEGESFVFRTFEHEAELVPGGGGTFRKIDSTVFPVSKTIAATFMTLEPGALRELHWHPNVCAPPSHRGMRSVCGTDAQVRNRRRSGCSSTAGKPARRRSSGTRTIGPSTSTPAIRPCSRTILGKTSPGLTRRRDAVLTI